MAKQVQFRRGNTEETEVFTGAEGEITVNTDDFSLRIHDGVTVGGLPVGSSSSVTMNGFFPGTPTIGQIVFAGRVPGPITLGSAGFVLDALTLPTSPVIFTLYDEGDNVLATFTVTEDGLDDSDIPVNETLNRYALFKLELTSAPNGISDIMYSFFTPEIL